MYTKELFHETVSILVKAYLNNTLEHGNYCACAVGNLLAEKVGAKLVFNNVTCGSKIIWDHPKFTGSEWYQSTGKESRQLLGNQSYHYDDICIIEKAFEKCHKPKGIKPGDFFNEQWMFNGLMAVVDVLCEIHGMNEVDKKEAKELFVKV